MTRTIWICSYLNPFTCTYVFYPIAILILNKIKTKSWNYSNVYFCLPFLLWRVYLYILGDIALFSDTICAVCTISTANIPNSLLLQDPNVYTKFERLPSVPCPTCSIWKLIKIKHRNFAVLDSIHVCVKFFSLSHSFLWLCCTLVPSSTSCWSC